MEMLKSNTSLKPAHPPDQNRRRGHRHQLHIPATVITDGANPIELPVVVTQLSVGGIAFRCRMPLAIATTCHFSSFDTLIPAGTRAILVTQRQMPDGDFEIGGKTI